jgi:hypothetical protein
MDECLHLGWDGHVWFGIITGGFMLGVYISTRERRVWVQDEPDRIPGFGDYGLGALHGLLQTGLRMWMDTVVECQSSLHIY